MLNFAWVKFCWNVWNQNILKQQSYGKKTILETILCKIASKISWNEYNLGSLYNKKDTEEKIQKLLEDEKSPRSMNW